MPIYEFRCDSCEKKFERLCSMSDSAGAKCPACGGDASKLFSTFFSGGGSTSGRRDCDGCASRNCDSCR